MNKSGKPVRTGISQGLNRRILRFMMSIPHQGPGAKYAITRTPGRPENNQIGFQDQGPKTIPGQAQKQSKMTQNNPKQSQHVPKQSKK